MWRIFLPCESSIGRRGDGRDVGINHPYLHSHQSHNFVSGSNQPRKEDERRTRTLESPPAVASLYCLPPAAVAAEELPFSILSLSSSLSLVVEAAKRRFSCGSGSGWKSHEYTACVSCQLCVVGQLGATARDWTGILTQSREPWVSWLGCVEVGCGYGGLNGRGKKRGLRPHDARKRIAPKAGSMGSCYSVLRLQWQ